MLTLAGVAQAQPAGSGVGVHLLSADAAGVMLELDVPTYTATSITGDDGKLYTHLTIPGFAAGSEAGAPDLPRDSILLAVPPGATLDLSVQVLAERDIQLDEPVYPVPAEVAEGAADPATGRMDSTTATGVREEFARDPLAYAARTPYPANLASLGDAGYLRDQRLARLTVYPLQYTPATGRLRHIRQMRIWVHFSGAQMTTASRLRPDTGDFDTLLDHLIINPQQAAAWRENPPAPDFAPVVLPFDQVRYRITLSETGIYQLTYADLEAAGVPVTTLDPRNLHLYHGDDDLAIEVIGEEDGSFDPGDLVRFYAEKVDSLYTSINTFWLVVGDTPGRRMASRTVAPQGEIVAPSFPCTQHFEQDLVYRSNMPMASGVDHWYWGQTYVLPHGSVLTYTVPFSIEQPLTGTASLSLELWGASGDSRVDPDHHAQIYLNHVLVGDVFWDGAVPFTSVVTFDQAILQAGTNELTLYTPGDTGARDLNNQPWEVAWLNFFDLTYQRTFQVTQDHLRFTPSAGPGEFALAGWSGPDLVLYDISDPQSPVRLSGVEVSGTAGDYTLRMHDDVPAGGAYYAANAKALLSPLAVSADAPSDLHTPAAGADYLLISHADFLAGVERLAEFRRSQGLRVRVIDVQDIYDEFSGGLLDPQAIRDFIQYAYFNWPAPAPSYVLLVGDGTYDFLDNSGYGVATFIPPYLACVDPVLGETAADNRYVAVVGDDIMPDLHLGRLPVNNQVELTAMLDKIIGYEATPAPGDWRTRTVFVADNPDSGGNFGELSDLVADHLPPELSVQKIYLGTAEYPLNLATLAQQATLDAFNRGALLFNYVGHSSISNWASEMLFGVDRLPQVSNGSFYPIVLPMTCLEGSYHNPRYASLGENVVRLSGRGAVASWSPTGLGVASGHDYLDRGFYDALFDWDVRGLGPATTAGKLNLFENEQSPSGDPRFQDLIDTYILLGDPATNIGAPEAQLGITATGPTTQLIQGDPVTYTLTYSNSGQAQVHEIILTATLPGGLSNLAWSSDALSLTLRPGPPLSWDLPDLDPGATGQVTITGSVSWDITAADLPFSAEMSISSPWLEPDYNDNRAGPLTATIAPADLYLEQTTEPSSPVLPGQRVTFTLVYADAGPGAAGGISLTLPLPVELDDLLVEQTGPALTQKAGEFYAWNVAPMHASDRGQLTVSGRVPQDISADDAIWKVTGRIATGWVDPDLGNNAGQTGTITVLVGDSCEPDNTLAQACRVTVPLSAQIHTYYPLSDQDWSVFQAQAGTTYVIRTVNLSTGGDTVLTLWNSAGARLSKNDDYLPGSKASEIIWTAPASGDYYTMVTSYLSPTEFSYELEISEIDDVYLPLVVTSQDALFH